MHRAGRVQGAARRRPHWTGRQQRSSLGDAAYGHLESGRRASPQHRFERMNCGGGDCFRSPAVIRAHHCGGDAAGAFVGGHRQRLES